MKSESHCVLQITEKTSKQCYWRRPCFFCFNSSIHFSNAFTVDSKQNYLCCITSNISRSSLSRTLNGKFVTWSLLGPPTLFLVSVWLDDVGTWVICCEVCRTCLTFFGVYVSSYFLPCTKACNKPKLTLVYRKLENKCNFFFHQKVCNRCFPEISFTHIRPDVLCSIIVLKTSGKYHLNIQTVDK